MHNCMEHLFILIVFSLTTYQIVEGMASIKAFETVTRQALKDGIISRDSNIMSSERAGYFCEQFLSMTMIGNEAAQYLSSLQPVQQSQAALEPNDVTLLQSYSLAFLSLFLIWFPYHFRVSRSEKCYCIFVRTDCKCGHHSADE